MTAEENIMNNVQLLPLPEWCQGCGESLPRDMQDYARANVAHATAAKDAEIEALRAEVETWKSLHASEVQVRQRWQARAERLAGALRIAEAALADIGDADREPGDDVAWCERRAELGLRVVRDTLRDAALNPTAAQENGDE